MYLINAKWPDIVPDKGDRLEFGRSAKCGDMFYTVVTLHHPDGSKTTTAAPDWWVRLVRAAVGCECYPIFKELV
jgi:hypothetical protein